MDFKSLWQYIVFATVGMALWLIQGMIGDIRQNTQSLVTLHNTLQRSMDDNTFRIKLLEQDVAALQREGVLCKTDPRDHARPKP